MFPSQLRAALQWFLKRRKAFSFRLVVGRLVGSSSVDSGVLLTTVLGFGSVGGSPDGAAGPFGASGTRAAPDLGAFGTCDAVSVVGGGSAVGEGALCRRAPGGMSNATASSG